MRVRPLTLGFLALALGSLPFVAAAPGGNKVALESALATVSAEEIRSDLFFIASDELEGRDTPSPGLKIAARFLRARLQRLGWQPGAKDGYFYTWQVEKKGLDVPNCRIEFGGKSLKLGKDYFLYGSVNSARETSATIVCAGEARPADIEKLEVEGKWVLILDRDQDLGTVRRDLGRKKAAGLLFVSAADSKGKPYAERFASALASQKEGRAAPARSEEERQAAESDRPRGSPSIYLQPEARDALLAAAGLKEEGLKPGTAIALELKETRVLAGNGGLVDVENVCGFWPGSDPVLKNDVIIVSAHYDHVGMQGGVIHNGADDNGSGTCTLLALAEGLRQYGPMSRSVMLMWVAGEEKGLWGSDAWNKRPYLPQGCKAVADINIDMVGRNAPAALLVTPTAKHESYSFLTKIAETHAPLEGFPVLGSADSYWRRSDHYNFVKAGIPATFLFSGEHEDYHKPTDDPDKIDYDKIQRVSRLVLRMLDALQNEKIDG